MDQQQRCAESGKVKIASRRRAEQVARKLRQEYDEPIEAYFCRSCGGFHCGSSFRPNFKRIRDN